MKVQKVEYPQKTRNIIENKWERDTRKNSKRIVQIGGGLSGAAARTGKKMKRDMRTI